MGVDRHVEDSMAMTLWHSKKNRKWCKHTVRGRGILYGIIPDSPPQSWHLLHRAVVVITSILAMTY